MHGSVAVPVNEASQVGEARRAAVGMADRLGFDEEGQGRVGVVTTEAATNLFKHAREGVVLLRALECGRSLGVEVLALDRGPGMADPARCMRDGYSTAGTPGNGLGAMARLSATLDLYSRVPSGTALVARLWADDAPGPGRFLVAGVSVPKAGESICGDSWAEAFEGGRALFLVADGLGHGPQAAEASLAAVRIFQERARLGPAGILQAAHAALRGTRGAAVAVAEIEAGEVRFAGVGNIAGCVLSGDASRSMVSHNGIVGHEARRFQEFTYPFPPGAMLVMHSDGVVTRWGLNDSPGLAAHDPALVAGVLYRDFSRGRDDATVLVARATGGVA